MIPIFAEECAAPILHGEQITFVQILTSIRGWGVSNVVSQKHGKMSGDVSGSTPYPVFHF